MVSFTGILFLFHLVCFVSGFHDSIRHHSSIKLVNGCGPGFKICKDVKLERVGKIQMVTTDSSPETNSKIFPVSIDELFTPPNANGFLIGRTLFGEGVLLNFSFLYMAISTFFQSNQIGIDIMSFDSNSMMTAVAFALPLIVGGFIVDATPVESLQAITRDTRIFVLRMLGYRSSIISSLVISLALALAAGFAEEVFFRSAIMRTIESVTTTPIAIIIQAAIFGFAHFPVFGASAFVEAIIGGVLGFSYSLTQYNLAVPIAIHTLYDFVTIFGIWYFASNDLNDRIQQAAQEQAIKLGKIPTKDLNQMADVVFDMIDLNRDGFIDKTELASGLRLYG